ncbi:MAG: hypothetical protein ACEQSB_00455 [Undibacterium sp.]
MKTANRMGPFADSRMAKFLSKRLKEIAPKKNQLEVAKEIGFTTPNVITTMKCGIMKVPLERVPALAKALDAEPVFLFRLALEQSFPSDAIEDIIKMFSGVATKNSLDWIQAINDASGSINPEFKPEYFDDLKKIFT